MKRFPKYLFGLLLGIVLFSLEAAASGSPRDTVIFKAIYVCDVDDTLDVAYRGNAQTLAKLEEYLSCSPSIDSVTIVAYASPEGGYLHNQDLSRNRATYFRDYIISHSPENMGMNEEKFRLVTPGENWEGLIEAVEKGYWRNDRERVLKILYTDNIGPETKKWRLQQLDDGYTYSFLIRKFMPDLRYAATVFFWESGRDRPILFPIERIEGRAEIDREKILPRDMDFPTYDPLWERKVIAALKTNLLYDAATVVNFSVELPFSIAGQNFSLAYDHYFPWWLSRDNRRSLEYLAIGGEARWWFKPKYTLQGHYLGAYAFSGIADLQKDTQACYQFEFMSAGLSYGYSMPLNKYLNLEFSLSMGYARIPYRHYNPTDDWQILIIDHSKEGVMHYFGPTRATVTLAIPITVKRRVR